MKSEFRSFIQFHCPISAKKFGENTLVVYHDAVSSPSLREIINDIVNNVSQHWKFIHVHKINYSHFQQCHLSRRPSLLYAVKVLFRAANLASTLFAIPKSSKHVVIVRVCKATDAPPGDTTSISDLPFLEQLIRSGIP